MLRIFWAKLSPLVDKALPLFPDLSGLVKQRATEYVACAQVCPNWVRRSPALPPARLLSTLHFTCFQWVAVWALLVLDALDIKISMENVKEMHTLLMETQRTLSPKRTANFFYHFKRNRARESVVIKTAAIAFCSKHGRYISEEDRSKLALHVDMGFKLCGKQGALVGDLGHAHPDVVKCEALHWNVYGRIRQAQAHEIWLKIGWSPTSPACLRARLPRRAEEKELSGPDSGRSHGPKWKPRRFF